MPIFTQKAEKLVVWLRNRKALDRKSGVTIPQASVASRMIDAGILKKATRRLGGGSQHTIYWLTEIGVAMAYALKTGRKCKECGCSKYNACVGGCSWIRPRLCSNPKCIAADARKKKAVA